jgi:ketopantoate reductase
VQLAERDSPDVRRVPVPVVEHPAGGYDLIAVCVRAHQVDAVLESLADVDGDVLFLLNWAAGAEPLGAVLGRSLGRSVRCRHCRNGCSSSCCGASCGARRPCTAA